MTGVRFSLAVASFGDFDCVPNNRQAVRRQDLLFYCPCNCAPSNRAGGTIRGHCSSNVCANLCTDFARGDCRRPRRDNRATIPQGRARKPFCQRALGRWDAMLSAQVQSPPQPSLWVPERLVAVKSLDRPIGLSVHSMFLPRPLVNSRHASPCLSLRDLRTVGPNLRCQPGRRVAALPLGSLLPGGS